MWGDGGRLYWGRKEERAEGIVVVFAWVASEERHLKQYVRLYGSLGWNSLACHADFLTLFSPEKATSLACSILEELVKEIKMRPLPIVFAAFSGGTKACMYKVLQIIDGRCEGRPNMDGFHQLLRDCVSGQIYDSSPVDFTSDLGARFVLHPTILKMLRPPRVVSWMAKAITSGLDTVFLNRFEAQHTEYWQTLFSSVNLGPFLIFCSEDDELAPYPIICNFAQHLQELGGDVSLVEWMSSPHVGHYKLHPDDYKAAVAELLRKAVVVCSQRMKQLNGDGLDGGCNRMPESIFNLHEVATSSNESLRVAVGPSDHLFLPSSADDHESKDGGTGQDEQKGGLFDSENPPGINAHGVLGKILFDVCVPTNVEGWDIKPVGVKPKFTFDSRRGHFNPLKLIRRSRL